MHSLLLEAASRSQDQMPISPCLRFKFVCKKAARQGNKAPGLLIGNEDHSTHRTIAQAKLHVLTKWKTLHAICFVICFVICLVSIRRGVSQPHQSTRSPNVYPSLSPQKHRQSHLLQELTNMSPSPVEVVKSLLANTSNLSILETLIAPNATYISLNYNNPSLQKILPFAGSHPNEGPLAVYNTFATVSKIWSQDHFEILSLFGSGGEDVAVFGRFTYRSRTLGKECTSPFGIWAKVVEGKVVFMQFMEDTLGTTASFRVGGVGRYRVFEGQEEFEV
ncbi:MAG: hypothetical protein Q9169_001600 [Polycauliona sp. 2 TL-2023]